jgi:ribose transport system substrate-binding protein
MSSLHRRHGLAALATLTLLLAACGSSTTSASTSATTAPASAASSGTSSTSARAKAATTTAAAADSNVAAAQTAIAPFEGHPGPFPVTQALAKRPAPGSKFVYLQCSTPVCALIGQLLVAPTKAIGADLTVINSGNTATSSQAAAQAALAQHPAAVMFGGVNPELFGGTLKALDGAGVAVTGVGIVGGEAYGVQESPGGTYSVQQAGKLMADWVVAHAGPKSGVVFFGTNELDFSFTMEQGFNTEMGQRCPTCLVNDQDVPVADFGTTAPAQVVSYLQAHPSVKVVVFASMEAATGLPAALKDANLHVTTLGFAPTPSNLQDIKNGGLTAGLGLDLLVQEWTQVDVTARLIAHQPIPQSELSIDLEFLSSPDINAADMSHGWTGYPDVAQRFAQLWSAPS